MSVKPHRDFFGCLLGALLCCALLVSHCLAADSAREKARQWLENLDTTAAGLYEMAELHMPDMDRARLRAVAEVLYCFSWEALAPAQEENSSGNTSAPESESGENAVKKPAITLPPAVGAEWNIPACAADIARIREASRADDAGLKNRVFRALRHGAALDRLESAIAGLDLVSRPDSHVSSEEAQAAYVRCLWLLCRHEILESMNPHEDELSEAEDDNIELITGKPEESTLPADCLARRVLRQDTLIAALDAALAFELMPDEALPLQIVRADLLLDQSRPKAALESLQDLNMASGSTPREDRLRVRGLYLRALALMRTGNFALAGRDLDSALKLKPEGAELRLARGTLLRLRGKTTAMCGDLHAACAGGLCEGLKTAREQGYCGAEKSSSSALLELKR